MGDLMERYKQEIIVHVQQELTHRLNVSHRINQDNAAAVALGLLDFGDPDMLEKYFWHQLQQNPEVNYVYAGNEAGGIIGVGRNAKGELRRYATKGFTQGEYSLYRAAADGSRQERIDIFPNFDARRRPWYKAPAQSGEARWSDIYLYVGEPLLGIAASTPVVDQAGQLRGVMATDLVLTKIGDFLESISISAGSTLFIMERSGELVATSAKDFPFAQIAPGEQQQRRFASDSADPMTRAAYRFLTDRFRQLTDIDRPEDLEMIFDGQRHFVHITPFDDERGLDWLITIVMPEQDFMSQIHRNTGCAIALCIAAVAVAIGLSVAIARRMSHPLWQLSEASLRLTQGDFSQQLPSYQIQELNVLSRSFNRMVQRLRDLFDQLEDRNAHLESRVEERTAHLTQANYQLRLLLRSVSHDLRNPIMGMLMVLNNIHAQTNPQGTLDRSDSGPLFGQDRSLRGNSLQGNGDRTNVLSRNFIVPQQVLETLISSGERQLRLVNSLLEDHNVDGLSEPDGVKTPPDPTAVETPLLGKRPPALRPHALRDIVDQVIQDVQPLLIRHQATLKTSIPDRLPLVLTDADQLWRVIENLVSNAIAHNGPGVSITITAEVVTSSRTGTLVCCKVIDDGVGVSLETQQGLFEPYHQANEQSPGLGLGLYVCRRIVEAHGGTVGVLSQPGAGATFWFVLSAVC
ncbi:MAG: ATP-binding protein [Elainellaceae cyanobacterium]